MNKPQLRKEIKNKLSVLTKQENIELSNKATNLLCNTQLYKDSDIILSFCSYGTEISTTSLLNRILKDNKKLALPKTFNEHMDFYYIPNENTNAVDIIKSEYLQIGEFGIGVPNEKCMKFQISNLENLELEKSNILIVMPGLAFDKNGTNDEVILQQMMKITNEEGDKQ